MLLVNNEEIKFVKKIFFNSEDIQHFKCLSGISLPLYYFTDGNVLKNQNKKGKNQFVGWCG